jgi:cell wall-associated protease
VILNRFYIRHKLIFVSLLLTVGAASVYSQATSALTKKWQWKDLASDSIHGTSLANAEQVLNLFPAPAPIIIAVLDGGIDTNHKDIKSLLWTNTKEIPNNNIDDDHNGYVDDIHGWNFLGGKNGQNINKASSEKARIYHAFKAMYENKTVDTISLSRIEKKQYRSWLAAANQIDFSEEERANLKYVTMSRNVLNRVITTLYKERLDSNFKVDSLENYQPLGRIGLEAKMVYLKTVTVLGVDKSMGAKDILEDLNEYIDSKEKMSIEKDQAPAPIRAKIVQDNYDDFNDKYYGNNDIMGPNSKHGTHVAGLASNMTNYIRIMGVRVVPDGDEYDKDIALGIHYAVDNGAKIINMSFGKSFSPQQAWVDSAIRYAASKDVLLIHSAGNEKYDLNTLSVYPNPYSDIFNDTANNIITVAASSDPIINGSLLTDFSNFGNKVVDLMSPGDNIYSTIPNNNYANMSGTSMSAPIVSHIAALIRAYFPQLTAPEVKNILMKSCWTPQDKATKTTLLSICKTGGIVNASNAVQYAQEYIASRPAQK